MANNTPYRMVTNLKYWLLASGGLVVGIALLYFSGLSWFNDHQSLGTLLNQLGGLLIASVALATLWDLVGRRSFLREMLEVLELKQEVFESGLTGIGTDYRKIVDWDDCLHSAKRLDIFAAWATTWRNNNLENLQQIASRSDAKIRVCLPDPTDLNCIKSLATRFNMSQNDVRGRLNDAIEGYKRLDANGSATGRVEIYTTSVFRAFTAYRIDNQFVVTLYHHKDNRRGLFPALTCGVGGSLFAFFEEDLEGALDASTKVYP
ncbi:hypothetical protein [Streptomyces sp. Root369]|uniref:hypothetical protein n=1 Tax=Streptomyces sp. Root369 TaxID=1736523 RepID=UPI00071109FF|nr:hypothetical protein [Streptomyces sp. Root369]KQW16898.1 hypothetical protein ASD08_23495 [Streptomyces sp. Root369]